MPSSNNAATPAVGPLAANIKSRSDNEYDVTHCELNNLADVAMQARIVPAFKQGKVIGFKLFSIRPDSIYTKIGLHNGDVLRRVNGQDLSTPETALGMFNALQNSSRIEIEIERNGSNLRKTFHTN